MGKLFGNSRHTSRMTASFYRPLHLVAGFLVALALAFPFGQASASMMRAQLVSPVQEDNSGEDSFERDLGCVSLTSRRHRPRKLPEYSRDGDVVHLKLGAHICRLQSAPSMHFPASLLLGAGIRSRC